jgi:hypothetical protein
MSEKSDIEALRALTSEPKNQTKIGRLRGLYDEIENLKKAGVKNKTILKTLNDIGFDINLNQLETMLYTIRKERKEKPNKTSASTPQAITPKVDNEIYKTKQKPELTGEISETKKDEDEEELSGLTPKQRREKIGDKYIKTETTNPILKNLLENKK